MTSTIAINPHSTVELETQRTHSGHNRDMNEDSCLQNNISSNSPSNSPNNEEDPLANLEAIEVIKQSDTTFVHDDENAVNNSIFSVAQDLMSRFGEMPEMKHEEQVLLSPDDTSDNKQRDVSTSSPNGVDQIPATANANGTQAPKTLPLKLDLPHFELHPGLSLTLEQPVLNRCSFYSVIHGINKEVQDMAACDQNCHIEDNKDEGSALVRAVNGPIKQTSKKETSQVELAVLDEEKFLLAAIASRDAQNIRIKACPKSFAEAIGETVESEALTVNNDGCLSGHSENPLSVVSASRTQLWKPSRSWWEAKSGKNPWIEPKLHNKRWRYLWPLIHYHKFLAKCIKKLKRNQVDVKTSTSPVSAFLREEVCAVSDHLASVSKFDSDQWMECLPHFQGWTGTATEDEKTLREIVKKLPMRILSNTKEEAEVPAFREIIENAFVKSVAKHKEQMTSGADEYRSTDQYGVKRYAQGPLPNQRRLVGVGPKGKRPPRHGRGVPSKNMPNRKYGAGGQRRNHINQYPAMNQMNHMMGHPMNMSMHHPMYQYDPYQQNQSMQYMPPNYYYDGQGNEWGHQMSHGEECHNPNFSYMDQSMTSTDMHFYPGNEGVIHQHGNWNGHIAAGQDASVSMISNNGEDASQCSDQPSQIGAPEGISLSFLKLDNCATPSKNRSGAMNGAPPSPHWGHLNMATLAVVASPGGRHPNSPQHFVYDHNENPHGNTQVYGNGQGEPPLISTYNSGPHGRVGFVPPSPATQFFRSSQANPQAQAYFAPGNGAHQYSSPAKTSEKSYSSGEKPTDDKSSSATTTETDSSTSGKGTQDEEDKNLRTK